MQGGSSVEYVQSPEARQMYQMFIPMMQMAQQRAMKNQMPAMYMGNNPYGGWGQPDPFNQQQMQAGWGWDNYWGGGSYGAGDPGYGFGSEA